MISERVIQIDRDRSVTVSPAESGIVLGLEDPHSVVVVEMGPEFVAQLVAALAPGLAGVDLAVWEIAARPTESVTSGPGDGFRDRVLLTVAERDALVAAAIAGAGLPAEQS